MTTPVRGLSSIKRRLAVKTIVTSASAVVLLTSSFLVYNLKSVDESLSRRLASGAEIVGLNSTTALLFDDPAAAEKSLKALTALPGVRAAAIYDAGGRLFATYRGERDEQEAVPTTAPDALTTAVDGDRLVVWRPILFEGKPVGAVLVRADRSERAELLRSYFLIALVVGLIVFSLAVLLSLRVQRAVMRPIDALSDTARAISDQKDFSVRAAETRVSELVPLVTAFNEILDNIQDREVELQEASRRLEETLAERTALYQRAEEANRLKDQFLATLSHELRTPLNAIAGWSALLESGQLDANGVQRAVATISRNVKMQTKLIEDILDVSRIVSGKLSLNVVDLDLPSVMKSAADALQPAADARRVRLQLVLDSQAGPVFGDPDRLQQAFANVLSNAVKFTPEGGRVYVRMWRPNSHVEITVADTGAGIAAEFLPHVFDRFRQGDSSSRRAHGGLGLGLTIVRRVVELHGGSVSVASDGVGCGTTVTIKLPLAPIAIATAPSAGTESWPPAPNAVPSSVRLDGLAVLVVDDDADSRELLHMTLTERGAKVRTAPSARDGFAMFAETRPDVVVSDIEMPGEDGYWLIEQIRARAPEHGGTVPAAALTAYARAEDRLLAIQRGFQIHLSKPVAAEELSAVVARLAAQPAEPRSES